MRIWTKTWTEKYNQWSFLVSIIIGGTSRWYIIARLAIYKWYILPIGGLYITYIPPIKGTRKSYWYNYSILLQLPHNFLWLTCNLCSKNTASLVLPFAKTGILCMVLWDSEGSSGKQQRQAWWNFKQKLPHLKPCQWPLEAFVVALIQDGFPWDGTGDSGSRRRIKMVDNWFYYPLTFDAWIRFDKNPSFGYNRQYIENI